ncbi:hypothetical protein, partial [Diaphorobacter sp.]|uniref:hypothetical protein n=1 Tax=Diaphorobacter sp. TaxID=1934310 RepID=UPI003D0D0147
ECLSNFSLPPQTTTYATVRFNSEALNHTPVLNRETKQGRFFIIPLPPDVDVYNNGCFAENL